MRKCHAIVFGARPPSKQRGGLGEGLFVPRLHSPVFFILVFTRGPGPNAVLPCQTKYTQLRKNENVEVTSFHVDIDQGHGVLTFLTHDFPRPEKSVRMR